jgi:hypothetical protein
MTTPLTTLLAQIREADEKATKGAWTTRTAEREIPSYVNKRCSTLIEINAPGARAICDLCGRKESLSDEQWKETERTADLIALYRTVTPLLAKMLEEAVPVVEELAEELACLIAKTIPRDPCEDYSNQSPSLLRARTLLNHLNSLAQEAINQRLQKSIAKGITRPDRQSSPA